MIEDKKKTAKGEEWPMTDIDQPAENDVPFGRGGFTNHHPGHKRYLQVVQDHQLEYIKAKKCDKAKIAWRIINALRAEVPPVRFLYKDPSTGRWNDVGDKKAREKTSQALREHQPFIKAVVEIDEEGETLPLSSIPNPQPQENPPLLGSVLPVQNGRFSRRLEAFRASRNEGPMKDQMMIDEPIICGSLGGLEGSGPSLGDFSVSQAPSFRLSSCMSSGNWEEELAESSQRAIGNQAVNGSAMRTALHRTCDLEFPIYVDDPRLENEFLAELDEEIGNRKLLEELSNLNDIILPVNHQERLKRPGIVKRGTSNQNETDETKNAPVKRCLLSRDRSADSNKLKQAYLPDFYGTNDSPGKDGDVATLGKTWDESFTFSS